ncbi:esterase [Amylostereum chailletii]|nr:esterase [Amylostereum chailletii]
MISPTLLPWSLARQVPPEATVSALSTDVPPRSRSIAVLLSHYETPGVAPPSSRVDPLLQQEPGHALSLWDAWKLGALFTQKATELASDTLTHHVWGPRKKSWGLKMTLLSSLMRNAGRHSKLVDITTIRFLISLGSLAPLPTDAVVTPLTFRVKRRGLRGLLAPFDAMEDGSRELEGEWIVAQRVWKRVHAEWKWKDPPLCRETERVILYLHGGAYYLFSPATHRRITIPLSRFTDARIFAVDYRLAPETRFPGPLHDAVATYLRMVEDLLIPPENILVAGDSAGGGLALALLMYLRDNDYPLPAGAILMSPWVDLTLSCDSWDCNSPFDIVPTPSSGDALDPIACYLGEHMTRYLTHPYASPLFGRFEGLPPLLIQAGDAEVLRDEITLLAHKAARAGVDVAHELYEDAIHVFQACSFLDARQKAFASCREFVVHTLPRLQERRPRALGSPVETKLRHETDSHLAVVLRDGRKAGALDSITSGDETDAGMSTDEPGAVTETDVTSAPEDEDEQEQKTPSPSATPRPPVFRTLSEHHPIRLRPQRSMDSIAHARRSTGPTQVTASLRMTPAPSSAEDGSQALRHPPAVRATSHPDIASLWQQWSEYGPANRTMTVRASVDGASGRGHHGSLSIRAGGRRRAGTTGESS